MTLGLDERLVALVEQQGGDPNVAAQRVEKLLQELTGGTNNLVLSVGAYPPPEPRPAASYGTVADDMAHQYEGGSSVGATSWDENL